MNEAELVGLIEDLKLSYSEYDEHLLRIHVLAYSVFFHILETKVCWILIKEIEWGYFGLIDFGLVSELLKNDPLGLRGLERDRFEELKSFVVTQLGEFVALSRASSSKYSSTYELLHSLSFTNPTAVVDLLREKPSEAVAVEESVVEKLLSHFRDNPGACTISLGDSKYELRPQSLDQTSFIDLTTYLIDEFFRSAYFYPSIELIELLINQTSFEDVDILVNYNSGIGIALLEIASRLETQSFLSVEAVTRNTCEKFLCEVALWTVTEKLGEPLVNVGDKFDDVKENSVFAQYHASANDNLCDLVIGIVPAMDVVTPKDIDKKFYKLSFGTQNYENAYIELFLSSLNEQGRAVVLLPNRFLNSPDSRVFREAYLSRDWIVEIIDVPHQIAIEHWGGLSIIKFDLKKDSKNVGKVVFSLDSRFVEKSVEVIRANNPDLDLSPSRFINTIEYEYQSSFELFDCGFLDARLRTSLLEVLSALEGYNSFDNCFNPCRKILEAVYHELLKSENSVPRELFFDTDNRINVENSWRYLSGMEVSRYRGDVKSYQRKQALFPVHIRTSAKTCQGLANPNSHYYTANVSPSAFKSAAFALLDLLEWFKLDAHRRHHTNP